MLSIGDIKRHSFTPQKGGRFYDCSEVDSFFSDVTQTLDAVTGAYEKAQRDNEELINKYISPEILFIDDLGTEPKYDGVTIECLYLLVNERKMKNLSTVITSNLDLADLRDRYDERIYSRIVDRNSSINIYLDGADKRIKK